MNTTLKKLLAAAASLSLLAGCASAPASPDASGKTYTVGLAQLVDHTSLNTIRDAIEDEFKAQGYDDSRLTINYDNAAGQVANIDTIMSQYAGEGVDAIIAIATPTAQTAKNYSDTIPVIFSAVSDPVGAGLVETIEAPGANVTGTSDEVQVDQIVDLILEIYPDAKTVGCLYNAGEANSVTNISNFKAYAQQKGLEVMEQTGTTASDLTLGAETLAGQCDVLFSPNDNTVASAMSTLGEIAVNAKVPYFVGADSMVQDGGFATVGIDYEELGRETARMAIAVLEGQSPADMPVKIFKDDLNIYINKPVLEALGVSLPQSILDNEKVIYMDKDGAIE